MTAEGAPPDPQLAVLGIETSCDETAAAVVVGGQKVLSSVVSSQIDLHARYGGVVPEIASRAHLELMLPVMSQALVESGLEPGQVGAVAATHGPGLIGALLVGVSAAKGLAMAWQVPFVAVNHLEAHLYAALLEDPQLEFPAVVLLVSGGHTLLVRMDAPGVYTILGQTLDDAAGEAFDKVARYLDLGYPGGPVIDRIALDGDARAVDFPRSKPKGTLNFSFSGLKTSVVNFVRANPDVGEADVAASFQEAVVDALIDQTRDAARAARARSICLAGGVAANSRLRERTLDLCMELGVTGYLPSRAMCTDNAAMVAAAGWHNLVARGPSSLAVGAVPGLRLA